MKEYFKYCSVEELKQQIKSRLAGAKLKLDLMHSRRTTDQSVDRKFYDYVEQIRCKQKQYEATISQSSELNNLLRKRRNKINESLDKYQRNIKCRTLTDFKVNDYSTEKSLNSHYYPQKQHTLLMGRANQPYIGQPRSKTEANFFTNASVEKESSFISNNTRNKQKTQPSQRNLRSITKVINITVDNSQQQNPSFSFAHKNVKGSENVFECNKVNAAKKKIRFDTAPSQIFEMPQPKKKNIGQVSNVIKEKCSTSVKTDKKSDRNTCIQKIKQRIQINYLQRKAKRMTTNELLQAYEDESSHRMVLHGLISSSGCRKQY